MVILNIIAAHRNPAYWFQPDVFEPQRFSPQHPAEGGRQAYFPFGGGPHLCIGNSFALMEGHIILAMIAQRFRLRFQSDMNRSAEEQRDHNHPFCSARCTASIRLCAPNFCMAAER
jgi:cytochrome P450